MPKHRGGRKKNTSNLEQRRKQWEATSDKSATKRPGSNKK